MVSLTDAPFLVATGRAFFLITCPCSHANEESCVQLSSPDRPKPHLTRSGNLLPSGWALRLAELRNYGKLAPEFASLPPPEQPYHNCRLVGEPTLPSDLTLPKGNR